MSSMELNQNGHVNSHDFSMSGGHLLNALVVPQNHLEQLQHYQQLQLQLQHQMVHNGLVPHDGMTSLAPSTPPPAPTSPELLDRSSKKKKKDKKISGNKQTPSKTIRRKDIAEYSQSHQSRIRDQLHKKLVEVAGGEDNVLPLLQNFFFSHEEGKKFFDKLHPPQQELQRFFNILPVLKHHCSKPNKKLFIRLLRQSTFTKSQAEGALGITICNDTWKKAGMLEETVIEKKRKINDEVARSVVEWMRSNTRPTKKTTQIKAENGEMETVTTHCVDCCYHHLYMRFNEGLDSKDINIPGLDSISESSFRKLIPKYIKLPKKKVDCQNTSQTITSNNPPMAHIVPMGISMLPPVHLPNWDPNREEM